MVRHEAVGVADPIVALFDMQEGVQEVEAVGIVLEDRLLLVAAGGLVVDGAGVLKMLQPQLAASSILKEDAVMFARERSLQNSMRRGRDICRL